MKRLFTILFAAYPLTCLPQAGTLLDLNTAQPTPPTGLTLSVPNASIVANFSFSPNGGPLFTAVQFVDLTQGGPTSWSWNFGDGGTSTSQNPLHTFSSGGVFTVSLTATGPGGSSSTNRSVTITVASGQPIWLDHFGSTGVDFGSAVVIDSASNSYVGGSFSGTVDFGGRSMTSVGSYDVFLNKYDSTGALQWCSRFGGTDGEQMKSLALDPSGNLLFSCNFITTNLFSQDSSSGQVVFPASQTRLDDVTVLHVNQTTTTYHAAANTDVARGEALFEAVTNGSAGDILYLRSETYDVGTNNVLRLDQHGTPGLSIVGNGAANTFVQTETDANVVFTFVRLGNGSVVSDLTLNNNAPPGTFSFPTGAFNGNGFTNALLLRLHINGGSDCIYVTVNNSTLEVRDCVLTSHYDCYNISSSNGVINVFNTPSTSTATVGSGFPNAAFGMTMGAGTFNVYNVTATGTGGAQENRGFGVGLNGTVNLYNCHAVTSGFDAHDLISTFGGGNFNVTPDTTYTTTDFSSGGGLTNIGKVGSLVKLSPQGTLVWTSGPTPTNSQQGVNFTRIATDSSGNVAVSGDFNAPFASQMAFGTGVALSSAFGSQDAFLAKYDTNGGCLWAKDFANTGDSELGTAVAVDASGNIYTGGYALSGINLGGGLMTNYVYGAFGFLGKFNPSGAFQWQRRVAEALSTDTSIGPFGRIRYLTLDTNQDVTLSGEFSVHANLAGEPMDTSNYVITATSPTYDAYIAKYAGANGAFQRAATIRGNETAQTVGLAVDSKNNVYGVGFFYGTYNFGGTTLTTFGGVPNISSDGWTAKFNPTLGLVWVEQFGSPSDGDQGTGIALDSGGYPVVTGGYYGTAQYFGWTFTNAGSTDIVIARILP